MIRDREAPTRPEIYYPQASLQATEHPTGQNFVNGFPIYKRGLLIPGGNNTSTITEADLADVVQFLLSAAWTCLDAGTFRFMRGNNAGVDLVSATGAFTIQHQTFDFTGETVVLIVEYTKLGGT